MKNSKQVIDKILDENKDKRKEVFDKILAHIPVKCLNQIQMEQAEQVNYISNMLVH